MVQVLSEIGTGTTALYGSTPTGQGTNTYGSAGYAGGAAAIVRNAGVIEATFFGNVSYDCGAHCVSTSLDLTSIVSGNSNTTIQLYVSCDAENTGALDMNNGYKLLIQPYSVSGSAGTWSIVKMVGGTQVSPATLNIGASATHNSTTVNDPSPLAFTVNAGIGGTSIIDTSSINGTASSFFFFMV